MAMLTFLLAMVVVPVLIAAGVTATVALVVRRVVGVAVSHRTFVAVGSVLPAAMLARAQYLLWPLPWWQPESLPDGIPPGGVLLWAAMPAWLACLLASRAVLRPRKPRRGEPHSGRPTP
ncbi:hypothetical protein M9979_07260 [Sphingomonas sp. RP10(2022)]|uniref:Uncharacterized protein n=1 Tax=Sphingomonas liriopis TaxID=2949094 RepID=A0A9X2KQK0_9SPHN|nr:hypothetical protein [Sphingomonas liriopis]MCP3734666.1 hypothetical protein [Sphingomonas liriopis]